MRTITVDVTAEDIAKGLRKSCDSCPVAVAMNRAGFGPALVGSRWIFAENTNKPWNVFTPAAVCDFVRNFDEGHPVSPFQFTLELPESP